MKLTKSLFLFLDMYGSVLISITLANIVIMMLNGHKYQIRFRGAFALNVSSLSALIYNVSELSVRLLLKRDDSGACRLVEECRSYSELVTNSSSISYSVQEHATTLSSSLDDILRRADKDSDDEDMTGILEMGEPTETTISMSGCASTKNFLQANGISWEPACDCQGHYKSVQCEKPDVDTQVCWCSSRGGSEKFNTRRTLTCDTAMEL